MGFSGNLTVGEILEQVVHADQLLAEEWQLRRQQYDDGNSSKLDLVRNIVFMGMGEVSEWFVDEVCRVVRGIAQTVSCPLNSSYKKASR
jgi:adenine C2-methylase RlmN of 23S rRNA A2503 and tRNA A37